MKPEDLAVLRRIFIQALVVFAACCALGLAGNALSPRGIPLIGGQWDPAKGIMHAGGPCAPKTQEMDITSLLFLMEQRPESLLVVDARSAEEYNDGHIPGAVSVPVNDVEFTLPAFMEKYDPAKVVVAYCSGAECWDSHELAEILKDAGCERVFVYGKGFPDWTAEQKPVEKGGP
jgi:rhodanese-related sulfurtransferase